MKKILLRVKKQLPTRDNILPVYAVITFVIYGWSLYWFLHELPAWIQYLYLSEILAIYLYVLMVNLFESLLILLLMLTLCVLLPAKWFYSEFTYRGVMLSLFTIAYLAALIVRRSQILEFSTNMINWFPLILFAALLFINLLERFSFFKKAVVNFADRATVFLYINVPVSIIAIVIIAIRSVF